MSNDAGASKTSALFSDQGDCEASANETECLAARSKQFFSKALNKRRMKESASIITIPSQNMTNGAKSYLCCSRGSRYFHFFSASANLMIAKAFLDVHDG